MSKLDNLKAWYTLDEAAARLTRKTGDQFATADLVQFVNDGQLAVWMDARDRYAVSVAPVCSYYVDPKDNPVFGYLGRTAEESLAQVPGAQKTTAWQKWKHGPETLEVLSPNLEVLTGPHRIDCREREDGVPITSEDPMRSAIRFLHGVLVFDDDSLNSTESGCVWSGSLLQLVRRRAECKPTPFPKIEDFEPDDLMPSRADLLISNSEIARFEKWFSSEVIEPDVTGNSNKSSVRAAAHTAASTDTPKVHRRTLNNPGADLLAKARDYANEVAQEHCAKRYGGTKTRDVCEEVARRIRENPNFNKNWDGESVRKYLLKGWEFDSSIVGAIGAINEEII